MANPPLFQRIRLVYRRSSLLLKVLVLVTILASAAALLALRGLMLGYQQQRQALQSQALQLQQENAELSARYAEGYDLKNVEKTALALGMIPAEQAAHVPLPATVPEQETQPLTLWERIGTFLTGLFA